MKRRIFNQIIVDESGSMATIKRATISGINETLQSIRHTNSELKDAESYVTLITFSSTRVVTIYDCINVEEAVDLTARMYCPFGCTPLYDAVGNGICALQKKAAPADTVFVTLITDGYENSSRGFNHSAIRKLIEDKKKADWAELNEEREELFKCCACAAPGTTMNEVASKRHFFSKRRKK